METTVGQMSLVKAREYWHDESSVAFGVTRPLGTSTKIATTRGMMVLPSHTTSSLSTKTPCIKGPIASRLLSRGRGLDDICRGRGPRFTPGSGGRVRNGNRVKRKLSVALTLLRARVCDVVG